MIIQLPPDLEAALIESARSRGIAPEDLALEILRERIGPVSEPIEPRDEWERRLLSAASDCGVSLPDSVLSSDGLYES